MSDELRNMDKEFEIFCDTKENCPKSIGMGCNVFHTANCKVKFLKSKIAELEKDKAGVNKLVHEFNNFLASMGLCWLCGNGDLNTASEWEKRIVKFIKESEFLGVSK